MSAPFDRALYNSAVAPVVDALTDVRRRYGAVDFAPSEREGCWVLDASHRGTDLRWRATIPGSWQHRDGGLWHAWAMIDALAVQIRADLDEAFSARHEY